jgi:uncharacterized protein (TIGR02147 family)
MTSAIDIFAYTDFRKFLADAWALRKQADARFSHRFIASKAGFSSSAFFGKLIGGDANLSPTATLRLAEIFHLGRNETRYFELLVLFSQARSHEEKAHFLDSIVAWRRGQVASVEARQVMFCEDWRTVVIRELLDLIEHTGDDKALGKMLRPPATASQVTKALQVLEELGLAKRDENGVWKKTDAVLSTGELMSVAIDSFRKETTRLALEAIDRFPREERSLSTLTVTLSQATLERLRDRLRHLRREILEMAREDQGADRVIQINLQAFPLAIAAKAGGQ